jgi:hypothetical protein
MRNSLEFHHESHLRITDISDDCSARNLAFSTIHQTMEFARSVGNAPTVLTQYHFHVSSWSTGYHTFPVYSQQVAALLERLQVAISLTILSHIAEKRIAKMGAQDSEVRRAF